MLKKWYSIALMSLLLLQACSPTIPIAAEAPAGVLPTLPAEETSAPVSTHKQELTPAAAVTATPTAAAATKTPEEPPAAGLEPPPLNLVGQSAVLIDAESGDILFDKNARQRMYPASTTKIMTAHLALKYLKPDEIITVGEEANLAWAGDRLEAQKAGLNYGQELTVKELLYGLMLASGSDAAITLAVNTARRESGDYSMSAGRALSYFASLMNAEAAAAGAVETNFTNPDGIHDPNHYSTAYDMALIARLAMQDAQFREIVATTDYQTAEFVTASGGVYSRHWENTNRLIQPDDDHYYAPATGIKTGTTQEAGNCLVSSALVQDRLVIAVVLGSLPESIWSDSVLLLEYARNSGEW